MHCSSPPGEYVYWANKDIEPNPVEVVNTVFFMQARPYFENLGNAMSATSYALMLYLNKNEFDAATPIMKWIQTQRNALMKFSGTQVSWLLSYLGMITVCSEQLQG